MANRMLNRLLDSVTIGAVLHVADANNMVVYHGTYGHKPIIARHYLNKAHVRDNTLVPSLLQQSNLPHVLSYLGVAIVRNRVYYIFESYESLLSGFRFSLVDADLRMNSYSTQILTCVLNGIQELRNVQSAHVELEACDVAIMSSDNTTEFVQAKIIIQERTFQVPRNANPTQIRAQQAKKQCEIDIRSIANIFRFCVRNAYPEADDFLQRLNITNAAMNDLLMAFKEDPKMILKHPVFWTPSHTMLFIHKVSETIQKIKGIQNSDATLFIGTIRALPVQHWNQALPPSIQPMVAGMNFCDSVDFVIATRNIDIHLVRNAIKTQKDITNAWKNFLNANPRYLMTCYNVVESFFGNASKKTGHSLRKWVIKTNYDDFLILPK